MDHVISFLQGVWDSVQLWQIGTSRTLRKIVIKVLPLYIVSTLVGASFLIITWCFARSWNEVFVVRAIWLLGWNLPIYTIGCLLQLRFAWVVASVIAAAKPSSDSVPALKRETSGGVSALIMEAIYGVVLSISYLGQTHIFCALSKSLLPALISEKASSVINVAMIAWATSFASFECKLIIRKCNLHQRIHFLETRWAYSLGYGFIASLVYNFFPTVFATTVWQLMQLLLLLRAISLPYPRNSPLSRLKIFGLAQTIATTFIQKVIG
jgi:hypothetical protein